MRLFILLNYGQPPTIDFQSKVLFNHKQFIGDEEAFRIRGVQDLKTTVKL
jgi:hypothetical protein